MKKLLIVVCLCIACLATFAQETAITTTYYQIGNNPKTREAYTFTLPDKGLYLFIGNDAGIKTLDIDSLETPKEYDNRTVLVFHCTEKPNIKHRIVQVIPKPLKGNCIKFTDVMTVGKRELPRITYTTETY